MAHDVHIHEKSKEEFELSRRRANEEMRSQLTMFAMMIFFTLVSFTTVIAGFDKNFIKPIILLLAGVQVVLQLYYFMHMKHKGHELPAFFMYTGMLIAFLTVLAMVSIVWW